MIDFATTCPSLDDGLRTSCMMWVNMDTAADNWINNEWYVRRALCNSATTCYIARFAIDKIVETKFGYSFCVDGYKMIYWCVWNLDMNLGQKE